jgi:hypothetical protein
MTIIRIGEFEVDIDTPVHSLHNETSLLHRIIAQQKHNETLLKKIMISQDSLNASATRLEAAAHTIIGLLPGTTVPSTPDTAVAAFQGRVDGASAAMEAAAASASSGTTVVGTPPPS